MEYIVADIILIGGMVGTVVGAIFGGRKYKN